ncbi:PaaI family thioesterase [Amorphus sp. 3PC139-8]|uniref:PaaI family thioesterase n=1 Tax=Amorphus sp. 3PC139-8 TaxID=2735676 RepID=UPI00345CACD3
MTTFDAATASDLLSAVFAPWIQDLNIAIERIGDTEAVLRMPFSDTLTRDNGVVCGQALMALADTAMVFAISAASGGYRPMTTVDQTSHFLRPVAGADMLATAEVVRLGRTMAFGRVTLAAAGDPRPAMTAQTAYAILGEPGK